MTAREVPLIGADSSKALNVLILVFIATQITACSSATSQETPPFKVYSASDGLWTERQGIGPDWYTHHSSRNYATIPYDYVFVLEENGKNPIFIEILSYDYKKDGLGYFELLIAQGDQTPVKLKATESAEKAPLCINLKKIQFESCSEDSDLLLIAPQRSLISNNIKWKNPSIFDLKAKQRKTFAISATSMSEINRHGHEWKKENPIFLPNAYINPNESRLSDAINSGSIYVTVNSDFKATAWQYKGGETPHIEYFCGSATDETPFAHSEKYTLKLDKLKNQQIYGISLCNKAMEAIDASAPYWPYQIETQNERTHYDFFLFTPKGTNKKPRVPHLVLSPNTTSWALNKGNRSQEKSSPQQLDSVRDLVLSEHEISFLFL